jgi:diguanylate cyclase (GGDEF)-like protein
MKPSPTPALSPSHPNPDLLRRLAWFEYFYLGGVVLVAGVTLLNWIVPPTGRLVPGWPEMNPQSALTALISALSLALSQPRQGGGIVKVILKLSGRKVRLSVMLAGMLMRISLMLAGLVAVLSIAGLLRTFFHLSIGIDILASNPGSAAINRMSPETSVAFTLVAVVLILMQAAKGFASHLADLCASCLCFLVLIEVSGYAFGVFHLFVPPAIIRIEPLTLLCLTLLTFAVFTRRAETGTFTIFLGNGMGSRITRGVTPVILLAPILWELGRAYAVNSGRMRAADASTAATAVASALGLALLLFMAGRLNELQGRVRDLSLRDETTGLYNARGFHLLAWQALRLAHRSNLPFSVLFIDLDNLNDIRDSLGPEGSFRFLFEMAQVMRAAFRETDVMGRIGADEFAVAGHFGEKSIPVLALRLQEAANYRNSDPGRHFTISFKIGYVTAKDTKRDSLEDLLAQAGKTIYRDLGSVKEIGA